MNCKSCGAPLLSSDEICSYCGTVTAYGERVIEERIRAEVEEELRWKYDLRREREEEEREAERRIQQEHVEWQLMQQEQKAKREAERQRQIAEQKREIDRRQEYAKRFREDRARFKYVPILLVPVFYVFSLLLYGPYWYISRAESLNNLSDSNGHKLNKSLCVLYILLCIGWPIFPGIANDYGITVEMAGNYWLAALVIAIFLSIWLAFRARYILKTYAGGFSNNFLGLPFDPFVILLFVAGPLYLQFEVNRMIKRGLLKPKEFTPAFRGVTLPRP